MTSRSITDRLGGLALGGDYNPEQRRSGLEGGRRATSWHPDPACPGGSLDEPDVVSVGRRQDTWPAGCGP
jgi:hypothetical protein